MCCKLLTRPVDIMHGWGLSIETHIQLQPKNTKVRLYYSSKMHFTHCTLLTRCSPLVLKVGNVIWMPKHLIENWFVVLR